MGNNAREGKRYHDALRRFDRNQLYPAGAAVDLVKSLSAAKFDETVELAVRLGVDPRKADQIVRGTVGLPAGTGKTVRVAVFAKGDKVREAEDAGADLVGAEDLAKRVEEGFTDFDVAIATPDQMGNVGKLGRVLGPRGLMPNPKTGTVTVDIRKAVIEIKAGKVEFRVDKTGIIHAPVGKTSFPAQNLIDNVHALVDSVVKAKPSAAKGKFLRSVTMSSTMGPGIVIDTTHVTETVKH